jgi:hypothetical protein
MTLICICTPRATDDDHSRSARKYITGRFSSGSPPKNVSTKLDGWIASIRLSAQTATRSAASSVIFAADRL